MITLPKHHLSTSQLRDLQTFATHLQNTRSQNQPGSKAEQTQAQQHLAYLWLQRRAPEPIQTLSNLAYDTQKPIHKIFPSVKELDFISRYTGQELSFSSRNPHSIALVLSAFVYPIALIHKARSKVQAIAINQPGLILTLEATEAALLFGQQLLRGHL